MEQLEQHSQSDSRNINNADTTCIPIGVRTDKNNLFADKELFGNEKIKATEMYEHLSALSKLPKTCN